MNIKLTKVWVVEDYSDEIKIGHGYQVEKFIDGIMVYENRWLVFLDKQTAEVFRSDAVYLIEQDAVFQRECLKQKNIAYCEKQAKYYADKVKKLKG